jgi:DNA-binding response OmpR family regulator
LRGLADVLSMASNCAPTLVVDRANPNVMKQVEAELGWPIHVLLIEDNEDSADLVRTRLSTGSGQKFRVEWRRSVLDGMGRLTDPGVDVVLLDLGLPELSGYQSYQAIALAAGSSVPIVILTADDSRFTRDLILQFGAADYLVKHESTPAQLRQALENAVASRISSN